MIVKIVEEAKKEILELVTLAGWTHKLVGYDPGMRVFEFDVVGGTESKWLDWGVRKVKLHLRDGQILFQTNN
jgi:hypothetical protein